MLNPSKTFLPCLFALSALANLGMHCGGPRQAYARANSCAQLSQNIPSCPTGTRCILSGRLGRGYTAQTYCLDSRNRQTGRYVYWRYGKLYQRGEMFESKRHGTWRTYNRKGQLTSRQDYHAGKLHGLSQSFRGKHLYIEHRYVGHKLHGETRQFYNDGRIRSAMTYHQGMLHGRQRSWSTSGLLVSDVVRIHGRLHGPWRKVESGTVTTGRYVQGLPEGKFVVRSLRGKTLGSFHFQSGDGTWLRYHPDGALREKLAMRLGMNHGPYSRYWASGKLAERGRFHINRREGRWHMHDFHGRPTQRVTYRNGRKTETRWVAPKEQQAKRGPENVRQIAKRPSAKRPNVQ